MAINYSVARRPRTRKAGWRRALALPALAAACATGGAPAPRGAPPLAPGSTPEPVRYEVVVPGPRGAVRARVARLLSDSMFHVSPSVVGPISGYNLARLVKVRIDLTAQGKDSVRVGLTGEMYVGDTARRDSISGLPERWRLMTAADPSALTLRGLARSVLLTRFEPPPDGAADSAQPRTGRGTGSPTDPEVAAMLASTPVGRALDVCRSAAIPVGWLVLYWRLDRSRCADSPDGRYPGEPNVMRIEREW
jgi:hypothetical protein